MEILAFWILGMLGFSEFGQLGNPKLVTNVAAAVQLVSKNLLPLEIRFCADSNLASPETVINARIKHDKSALTLDGETF